jgi:hypothetical protein
MKLKDIKHSEIDFSLISYEYLWDVKTFTSLFYKRQNLSHTLTQLSLNVHIVFLHLLCAPSQPLVSKFLDPFDASRVSFCSFLANSKFPLCLLEGGVSAVRRHSGIPREPILARAPTDMPTYRVRWKSEDICRKTANVHLT